jgi:CelD/BcsL family acetyltransferase involved in cellulose biosynthesis
LPGCFASRAFAAFHRDVWKNLAATGQALIYWLEMEGTPIAVDYVLLSNETMCGYQSGVDPDHMSMQPGQLMNSTAIRAALESGYKTYDFLRGDEPYKAHLGAERHEMLSASVVPQNAEARLRYAAWNAGRQMRGLAKRGWRVARDWREGRKQPEAAKNNSN